MSLKEKHNSVMSLDSVNEKLGPTGLLSHHQRVFTVNSCYCFLFLFSSLEGFQVVQLAEVISTADIIVTCTGRL